MILTTEQSTVLTNIIKQIKRKGDSNLFDNRLQTLLEQLEVGSVSKLGDEDIDMISEIIQFIEESYDTDVDLEIDDCKILYQINFQISIQ